VNEALPFVKDLRRSNVCLTRAKAAFFFIGHYEAICSRAHKSKNYEIRKSNEAWHWLGVELSKRRQVFDCKPHTLESLIVVPAEVHSIDIAQQTTGITQERTPPLSMDGRVLYDMHRVRGDQRVTCACEACTSLQPQRSYSVDDVCDADLRDPGEEGQYGMMAELSYNLHFLCNSNPTPVGPVAHLAAIGNIPGRPH
jgi:hypothetical protein